MAAIATILGGTTGFLTALVALVLFNASWLVALALWSLGGIAVALLLVALAMTAGRRHPELVAEHA
ncbi:MAG: hypothetical protein E6Q73_06265 [Pseudorhodobacter sp.]|nr:MAG: hypothetical protein E6Q73_06265 [Pseudorhodobacter sp.]